MKLPDAQDPRRAGPANGQGRPGSNPGHEPRPAVRTADDVRHGRSLRRSLEGRLVLSGSADQRRSPPDAGQHEDLSDALRRAFLRKESTWTPWRKPCSDCRNWSPNSPKSRKWTSTRSWWVRPERRRSPWMRALAWKSEGDRSRRLISQRESPWRKSHRPDIGLSKQSIRGIS